jgi:hypothetical protein
MSVFLSKRVILNKETGLDGGRGLGDRRRRDLNHLGLPTRNPRPACSAG